MATIGRRAYVEIFGPTVGDRVRLADTNLLIEVEQDKKDLQGMYKELSEDFQSAKDTIAVCAAVKEAVEYNSMQD